jgi:hypothetical protein
LFIEDEGLGWGRDVDGIDLRHNGEAGLPSSEEADVLVRKRIGRVEESDARVRRLAVGNVIAHLQMKVPTAALEKGHVLARDLAPIDNAIGEGAVFEIERK